MVKVKVLSYLAEIAGFEEREFHVDEPVKLISLIPSLEKLRDRVIVLVNGKPAGLDVEVSGEDEVTISPVFGGG